MNKKLKTTVLVGAAASASTLMMNAQSADTATANVTADIITAISITKTADLAFGSAVADAVSAGTVVVDVNGSQTCTTVACPTRTTAAAAFDVAGQNTYTYAISLPTSTTLTSGTNNMTVDTFVDSKGGTGTLTASGDSFTVGATLHVTAAQPAGNYTGTFDVTVAYN